MADGTGNKDVLDGAILQLAVLGGRETPATAQEWREIRFQIGAIVRALETLRDLRAPVEGPDAEVHELRPRLRPEGDDNG